MGRAAVTRNSQKKGPSAPSHCQQLERLPENRDKASGRSPWPQRDPAGPEDPGDPGAPAVHPRGVKARTGAESPGDPKTREHRDDTDSRTCALEKTPARSEPVPRPDRVGAWVYIGYISKPVFAVL
ncbi:uncharacterized protein AAEQ78_003460 isoform 2-T4 [Lycaon pictus]